MRSANVDRFTSTINKGKSCPWLAITKVLYWILLFIVLSVNAYRTDFFNLLICCSMIFNLYNLRLTRSTSMRYVLFALLFSMFYDIAWFSVHYDWWFREIYDGDVELNLRRFVIIASVVSFFFKFIIIFFTWKVSVDYITIVDS